MPSCPYCYKKFGRISALQNHSAFCAIIHQGKYAAQNSEQELDVPPIRDMYIVLQKLVMENEKLRGKVDELEKLAQRQRKKMCLIDWLNDNKQPDETFSQWVNKIVVTEKEFQHVLENNCINGVMEIIKKNINEDINPICGFDQKLRTLFIYTNSWRIIENEEFYRFIDSIVRKLGKQFDLWMNRNNAELIKNDEKIHLYTKKLYSADIEDMAKRLHLRLYNYIKYNLKNIVDYEFTF